MSDAKNSPAPTDHAAPCWLLSICAHLGLLTLLALLIGSPAPQGIPAGERRVGIAVATGVNQETEYRAENNAQSSLTDGAEPLAEDPKGDGLPQQEELAEMGLPEIALPGSTAEVAPGSGLVPQLDYAPATRGVQPSAAAIRKAKAADRRRREQRPRVGPQTDVSLFGSAAATGNSFIFLVDRSDSMGRGGLGVIELAKEEFRSALAGLGPEHRFQILAYNHQRAFFGETGELLPASTQNKTRIGKFMSGLAAFGATSHFLALDSALNRSPDVIFLLTDGGDPVLSHPEMVRVLRKARGRSSIHCVEFGSRPRDGEENFLHRLARETGGSYRHVDVSR